MADQDFNIKVVTTADTTGIRQTSAELDKLKQQQATFTETARRQAAAAAAAKPITPTAPAESGVGVTGTAVGLGTIVTLLTASLSKWREFNAEQDRWVDGMIKSQEKSRELGLSVADMLDAMKSAERIETEPLQVSFDRLKQKVIELKTEMQLAFGAGQYEDVKRYAAALGVVESQLHRVTSALKQQAEAEKRATESREQKSKIETESKAGDLRRPPEALLNELAEKENRDRAVRAARMAELSGRNDTEAIKERQTLEKEGNQEAMEDEQRFLRTKLAGYERLRELQKGTQAEKDPFGPVGDIKYRLLLDRLKQLEQLLHPPEPPKAPPTPPPGPPPEPEPTKQQPEQPPKQPEQLPERAPEKPSPAKPSPLPSPDVVKAIEDLKAILTERFDRYWA